MKYFLKKNCIWLSICLVITLTTFALLFIKTDYDITTPAMITPINDYIKVEGSDDINPDINSVSVYGFERASLLNYLFSKVNPFSSESKLPDYIDTSDDYISEQGEWHRELSINNAIVSAYQEAGYEVNVNFIGYIVTTVYLGVTADIKIGDIITKVEGEKLSADYSFTEAVRKYYQQGFEKISCELTRSGKKRIATITFFEIYSEKDQKNVITHGINAENYSSYTVVSEDAPGHSKDHGNSIGPSGGLMQALYIYEKLTGGKLTNNLKIAGTGAIDLYGNAGLIGGIEQKIYTADACNVDIFFVPVDKSYSKEEDIYSNWNDAKKAYELLTLIGRTNMKIVPVSSLSDIIEYLEGLE